MFRKEGILIVAIVKAEVILKNFTEFIELA
jgi:hypothetical protein